MKKLMFAAALAAVGSAFAIESANTVGYQETTPMNASGYSFIIPTFVDVGSSTATYDLQNIKLVDACGDGGTDLIYVYDSTANLTGEKYYWGTVEDSEGDMDYEVDGWYDGQYGENLVSGVELPVGTGLYLRLSSLSSGAKVQYAGQVYQAEAKQNLVAGYNMIGNSMPKQLDLQSIKLENAIGDGGTDVIYEYDSTANLTGEKYYWGTVEDSEGDMDYEVDGWYDGQYGENLVGDLILEPGQGLYLRLSTLSAGKNAKVVIPNPMTYTLPE